MPNVGVEAGESYFYRNAADDKRSVVFLDLQRIVVYQCIDKLYKCRVEAQ